MTEQIDASTLRPSMRTLSEEQVQVIHHASLDILARTGFVLKHEKACQLLCQAGAYESDDRIKIPSHIVMDCLSMAPPRIPMHDRNGKLVMPLEPGKVFFGTGSDCVYTMDIESGERRQSKAADVERFARLADALEGIDFVMSMGTPSDVPTMDHYLHSFIRMVRGSIKPNLFTANDRRDMEDIYQIACAIAGSEIALREKPFLLHYAEPISPLLFNHESVDKLMFCAEKGIPAGYIPSPNTGGGGPITLAGAIALGNAEILAGLCISQLVRRGTPYLYGMNTAALDMKSAIVAYGAPEWPLGMAAHCDIARHYHLPVWGAAGATDSKLVDAQAGIEATTSIMSAFLSRCNLVHDVGYIEYGNTSSMEMIVMADEIIREIRYMMNGLEINASTLAREAIHRATPGSGFLSDSHTLKNWRWAQWRPDLLDRSRYDTWVGSGGPDLAENARQRALHILGEHRTQPLPTEAETVIASILEKRTH